MDALSVRRTFIDCVRDGSPSKTAASRSSSAPPTSLRVRNEGPRNAFESGEYIAMLLERARSVIRSKASAQNSRAVSDDSTLASDCDQCGIELTASLPLPQGYTYRSLLQDDVDEGCNAKAATSSSGNASWCANVSPSWSESSMDGMSPMSFASSNLDLRDPMTWGYTSTSSCDRTCLLSSFRSHSLREVARKGYRPFVPAALTHSSPTAATAKVHHTSHHTASECPTPYEAPTLQEGDTTLMLVDLPGKLSVDGLVESLNQQGFDGAYDLVYMPPRKGCRAEKRTKSNIGFCFVNFKSSEYALAFVNGSGTFAFEGFQKRSSVKRAKCQGFQENLDIHSKQCVPGSLRTFD